MWDSEGFSETTDTVVEDLFAAVDDDSDFEESCSGKRKKDSGDRKKGNKRRKHSSASGECKESSDDESDESDEKACRFIHHTVHDTGGISTRSKSHKHKPQPELFNIITSNIYIYICYCNIDTCCCIFTVGSGNLASYEGKKKKRGGKKLKAGRGKGKKETKEKKEKRLRKEQEKLDKEKEKEQQKAVKEQFNKGKKAQGACVFHCIYAICMLCRLFIWCILFYIYIYIITHGQGKCCFCQNHTICFDDLNMQHILTLGFVIKTSINTVYRKSGVGFMVLMYVYSSL